MGTNAVSDNSIIRCYWNYVESILTSASKLLSSKMLEDFISLWIIRGWPAKENNQVTKHESSANHQTKRGEGMKNVITIFMKIGYSTSWTSRNFNPSWPFQNWYSTSYDEKLIRVWISCLVRTKNYYLHSKIIAVLVMYLDKYLSRYIARTTYILEQRW